jgi:general L-amino acid transport system permease protein
VAIAASFPLGVMLALGRRSSLPLVKIVSVGYIELVRAVPLVTVLFMASIMLPLVLPSGIRPSSVLRALAGLTLFSAAYVAEDVRGGLASVERGQYDAATAVGLGTFATYRLVVLPQAIRTVIPAIVGQFISLFKDTSLVIIIGLRELLGIAQAVVNQPDFLGLYREVLVFIAVIYFIFSTVMSRTSRKLERELGAGEQ